MAPFRPLEPPPVRPRRGEPQQGDGAPCLLPAWALPLLVPLHLPSPFSPVSSLIPFPFHLPPYLSLHLNFSSVTLNPLPIFLHIPFSFSPLSSPPSAYLPVIVTFLPFFPMHPIPLSTLSRRCPEPSPTIRERRGREVPRRGCLLP